MVESVSNMEGDPIASRCRSISKTLQVPVSQFPFYKAWKAKSISYQNGVTAATALAVLETQGPAHLLVGDENGGVSFTRIAMPGAKETKHRLAPTKLHQGGISDIALLPRDAGFVCSGDDSMVSHVRILPSGGSLLDTATYLHGHSGFVTSVDVAKDGCSAILSSSTDGTVRLWDVRQRNSDILHCEIGASVSSCCFTPGHPHTIVCAPSNTKHLFQVWDLRHVGRYSTSVQKALSFEEDIHTCIHTHDTTQAKKRVSGGVHTHTHVNTCEKTHVQRPSIWDDCTDTNTSAENVYTHTHARQHSMHNNRLSYTSEHRTDFSACMQQHDISLSQNSVNSVWSDTHEEHEPTQSERKRKRGRPAGLLEEVTDSVPMCLHKGRGKIWIPPSTNTNNCTNNNCNGVGADDCSLCDPQCTDQFSASSVQFTSDGRHLITATRNGIITMWDMHSTQNISPIYRFGCSNSSQCKPALGPQNFNMRTAPHSEHFFSRILIGLSDGHVKSWELMRTRADNVFGAIKHHTFPVRALYVSQSGSFIASSDDSGRVIVKRAEG